MFTTDEWKPIVTQLADLTEHNKLDWNARSSYGSTVIFCKVGSVEYSLGSVDDDSRPPYFLAIKDGGKELDRISMGSPKTYDPRTAGIGQIAMASLSGMNSLSTSIFSLFNAAQRQALKIPERAVGLLDQLEALGREGTEEPTKAD